METRLNAKKLSVISLSAIRLSAIQMMSGRIVSGIIGFALLTSLGCATTRKADQSSGSPDSREQRNSEAMGPPEAFGPTAPPTEPSYGPDPIRLKPIVLVLGPGMARGFAYVGVIQALHSAHIPIGAILGTEMGGFVGALYSSNTNINKFEWGLLKFKQETFRQTGGFLSMQQKEVSDGKKFETLLAQVFHKKDISEFKIPIKLSFQGLGNGQLFIVDHGSAVDAVRATMATPELFLPGEWKEGNQKVGVVSAATSRPFMVNEGRALGLGPIVAVDVITDAESVAAWDELKEADLVIKPDLTGIDKFDFQKRTDAAFRGKSATLQHLPEIRHLVGLPENELDSKRSVDP